MLLDTDVLIDLVRTTAPRHASAKAWFATLPALPAVAGIAAMELVNGCQNLAELRAVQTFLRPFPILWPSETDMNRALTDYIPLRLTHGIGLMDALIAATATGHGLPIATFNVKHFRALVNVTTVQPYPA